MNIEQEDRIPRLLPANLNCTFDLLNNEWCYHHTRFNVWQLWELYLCLDLPVNLNISTRGHKASFEEAFIITLTKLATVSTSTSLVEVFGATTDTFISRVYATTISLLDNKADRLLHGNVCSIGCCCLQSLQRRLGASLIDLNTANCCFKMWGLLAFWITRSTRLAPQGPVWWTMKSWLIGVLVWRLSRKFSTGYLIVHGLKVLTVVFPNGIFAYLYVPVSARENNIGLLNLSWLNEHLVALEPEITATRANSNNLLYFCLYGDKIFPYLQCITHAHEPPLGLLFQVMQHKHQKKYFSSTGLVNMMVHKQLHVIFFIYNCYVCFHGNKFMKFFDLPPPSLADYLDN